MFTGIVESVGRITGLEARADGSLLRIQAGALSEGVRIGDSVVLLIPRPSGRHSAVPHVRQSNGSTSRTSSPFST